MAEQHVAGDTADDRRSEILAAAAALLAEGGYAALSIRSLAARAKISLGLVYYYFADKHAVFEALMRDHQRRMTAFLDECPRTGGVAALLRAAVPVATRQWLHVGRMVAVWRTERPDNSAELREQRVGVALAQFDALRRALDEAAAAEGRTVRPDPEIVPFVWAGLMGLADLHAQGWVGEIDVDRLTELTVTSLVNQILDTP
ncbi:TetR/AcrR family transcriptional regulator [Sphaerimonospora cavernae]|uniref:TetR/AcrR family transcriptional regulator n=1 Tax=Sphaerimonospora cavernae TaxID=1740611 RepID=A0ABV6U3Y6_9ACTN